MAADRMPFGALLLLFTALLNSVLFADSAFDISKKRIAIRKLDMCKGKENLPLRWSSATITYDEDTKQTYFGLNLSVLKEVGNNFAMSFSFMKCDSSGNPDSCEYFLKNYLNKEICKYLGMKNQGWTPFIEHFDKPLTCPIKPGNYSVVDCPINADFLRFIPIGDAVWKVNIWGYEGDIAISCVDLELLITTSFKGRRSG